MKTCRHCGRENEDDAIVCPECGTGDFRLDALPPPVPSIAPDTAQSGHSVKPAASSFGSALKVLAVLGLVSTITLVTLRGFGLIRPFNVPTAAMAPAVRAGDHVFMENFTFLR